MNDNILLARGSLVQRIPGSTWETELARASERMREKLTFMTADHHRVRYHLVKQLPRSAHAITPFEISEALSLPVSVTRSILDDLERNLFFLVRNHQGNVVWAFPVTLEPTPHRLKFSTGEETYAA